MEGEGAKGERGGKRESERAVNGQSESWLEVRGVWKARGQGKKKGKGWGGGDGRAGG